MLLTNAELRATASRKRKVAGTSKKAEARVIKRAKAEIRRKAGADRVTRTGVQEAPGIEAEEGGSKERAIEEVLREAEGEPASRKLRPMPSSGQSAQEPRVGVEPIDLTAETPPEEQGIEIPLSSPPAPGAVAPAPGISSDPGAIPAIDGPDGGAQAWIPEGEAPAPAPAEEEEAPTPVLEEARTPTLVPEEARAPTLVPEEARAPAELGEMSEALVTSLRSVLDRGGWAEQIVSPRCLPEVYESLLHRGQGDFYRDVYASLFWVTNSFATLRMVLSQAETTVLASRGEVNNIRSRLEEAERTAGEAQAAREGAMLALEEARHRAAAEAEKARGAEEKLKEVEEKLKEAEGELYAQETRIYDLRNQAQAASERADMQSS